MAAGTLLLLVMLVFELGMIAAALLLFLPRTSECFSRIDSHKGSFAPPVSVAAALSRSAGT